MEVLSRRWASRRMDWNSGVRSWIDVTAIVVIMGVTVGVIRDGGGEEWRSGLMSWPEAGKPAGGWNRVSAGIRQKGASGAVAVRRGEDEETECGEKVSLQRR